MCKKYIFHETPLRHWFIMIEESYAQLHDEFPCWQVPAVSLEYCAYLHSPVSTLHGIIESQKIHNPYLCILVISASVGVS